MSPAADILYQLSHVRKTYTTSEAGQAALDIDRLDIPRNRVVVILGESGSGKTTLLNMLGMLDTPDTDQLRRPVILFNAGEGVDEGRHDLLQQHRTLERLRRRSFGFVFQEGYLLHNLTARANIKIPLFINGLAPDAASVATFLDSVDLPGSVYGGRLPAELSGGEAQRIAIIRAIIHNPRVIIADEPSSRLDSLHGWQVMRLLTGWCHARRDRSLILVTHNQELANAFAEHIITLADGRVIDSQPNSPRERCLPCAAPAANRHDSGWPERPDGDGAVRGDAACYRQLDLPYENPAAADSNNSREVAGRGTWDDIPVKAARIPWLNTIRFVLFFAFADIFPPVGGRNTGIGGFCRTVSGVRRTQGLNILSLFMVLLLAFFFSHTSSWLTNYFVWSVSHPRINNIIVNGKKHGEAVLSQDDREKLASLSWASDSLLENRIVPWNEETDKRGLTRRRPAVLGAYGSRDRLMDFYFNSNSDSAGGWSNILPVDLVAMDAADPMLDQITLQTGASVDSLAPSAVTLASLFRRNERVVPNRPGVVLTLETVKKDLGYADRIPETVTVNLNSRPYEFPLLGISDWLPFSAGALVSAGWYESQFLALGPGDPVPGYDRLTIYIKDMLKDGLPVANAIHTLGYQTSDNIRNRLTWIRNLTDFAGWFALLAIIGIAVLVAGTLMVSYTQAIRRKQKEIGVLLAHGIGRKVLYAIFLAEITVVWLLAVGLALPLHRGGSLFLKQALTDKFRLEPETVGLVFRSPELLQLLIFGISLLLAWLAVSLALQRTIRGRIAEILKYTD